VSLPLNQVIVGDCVEIMTTWPENSVDCIVTDPPYGIDFMGKEWDKVLPPREAFIQMIRVLKPGALAFVMSSPRQDVLWRMLALLEGVGFELRQSHISWIYKSGFPKAFDVSLGIDRKVIREEFKAEYGRYPTKEELKDLMKEKRKTIGYYQIPSDSDAGNAGKSYSDMPIDGYVYQDPHRDTRKASITEPYSPDAKKWSGWKSQTGLKPAVEMVLIANKPRSEPTIVDNVLRWGTGAINVDASRIPFQNESDKELSKHNWKPESDYSANETIYEYGSKKLSTHQSQKGRFPANLIISDGALDTGETTKSGKIELHHKMGDKNGYLYNYGIYGNRKAIPQSSPGDEGSPFRFFDLDAWGRHHGFLDVAKPSRAERDMGLWTQPLSVPKSKFNLSDGSKDMRFDGVIPTPRRNVHPTCKPVKLMAFLITLGCPPKGIIVDPFLGSGTTCIAAKKLRRKWIGIEIDAEYAEIAEARINIKGPLDQYLEAEIAEARINIRGPLDQYLEAVK